VDQTSREQVVRGGADNPELGNRLERVVQRTKHRNSNSRNHGPFRHTLPQGRRRRIVMLHLFVETIEHHGLLTSATVLLIAEEHNGTGRSCLTWWRPRECGPPVDHGSAFSIASSSARRMATRFFLIAESTDYANTTSLSSDVRVWRNRVCRSQDRSSTIQYSSVSDRLTCGLYHHDRERSPNCKARKHAEHKPETSCPALANAP
jgi:hypothetical protein